LTTHHEATIASALASGVIDYIVVVASDVIPGKVFHTTVTDRQNAINTRFTDDPNVICFPPHSVRGKYLGLGWVTGVVKQLRRANLAVVPVVLDEDYESEKKRKRLASLMPADEWLVLVDKTATSAANASADGGDVAVSGAAKSIAASVAPFLRRQCGSDNALFEFGKLVSRAQFTRPPSSKATRDALSKSKKAISDASLPLSPRVRQFIGERKLYAGVNFAGHLRESFRSTFGTKLGELVGTIKPVSEEVKVQTMGKLHALGLLLKKKEY
jgi:hypothetical protein